ncbi:MAG: hypothetical protein J6Y02_06560 [Pseudobutyrivibrio sp.]|nr:hypothetical protein [Pseudobutyrivibrio sp.]
MLAANEMVALYGIFIGLPTIGGLIIYLGIKTICEVIVMIKEQKKEL